MADDLEIVNGGTPPNERCSRCGGIGVPFGADLCIICFAKDKGADDPNLLNQILSEESKAALERALRAGVAVGTIVSPTCRILQGAMGIADAVEQCTVA